MATQIYSYDYIYLIDGTQIEISPLKIKYLRRFMEFFNKIKDAENEIESLSWLSLCGIVACQQFYPEIKTIEDLEEMIDLPNLYKLVNTAGTLKIEQDSDKTLKEQASNKESSGQTWDDLDLARLEAELFLLGIWKDYEELEKNISMPELLATLSSLRDLDYQEKKFLAAIQGVDLDKESGKERGQKEWEDLKARVFSKGQATDSNDVLALQGQNAKKAGFGIGMGLEYEDARDPSLMKN
jgi:hypothetical protein